MPGWNAAGRSWRLGIWPQFCAWPGTPFTGFARRVVSLSSVYHWRSSCPEKAQKDRPLTSLRVPLPVISPANTALVAMVSAMAATPVARASFEMARVVVCIDGLLASPGMAVVDRPSLANLDLDRELVDLGGGVPRPL